MLETPQARWLVRGTAGYRRATLALFLAGFSTFSLLYCVQPLLPIFAEDFGVSPAASALPLSLATAALAFAILVAAVVSEGFGRRGVMFVSMALASVLTMAAAAAPSWTMLLLVRTLSGFVLGGVPAVAMTYLAEETDPRSIGLAMGVYVGGTAFGGMMGRVATGFLTEFFGWRPALAVIGLICLVSAGGFLALLPPSRNFTRRTGFDPSYHVRAWLGHLHHGALPLLFSIAFLAMGAFVTIYNYSGYRLVAAPYDLSQTELGLIFVVYLFGVGSSSVAGALADRFGRHIVLPAGILVAMAGIGITMLPGLGSIILGIVIITIGFFFSHSVATGWVGRVATSAKGHASSLYLLAYYMGSSVAGWMGGWFWAWKGWPGVAAFTLGLFALALCAALRLNTLTRADSAEPSC
ncbi:MAG: major facilitator superfamily protein [Hyphomicrobiales bacterium]|nr:major facilitator superfamily protein [Hyphomicrobiales bacterium]